MLCSLFSFRYVKFTNLYTDIVRETLSFPDWKNTNSIFSANTLDSCKVYLLINIIKIIFWVLFICEQKFFCSKSDLNLETFSFTFTIHVKNVTNTLSTYIQTLK